jgi:hypothetical protein
MQTIDPAAEETKVKVHRPRRIAWSIAAVIVCIAIGLIILSLLSSEPERSTGVASRGEDPAVARSTAESETALPAREHLVPESAAPAVGAVPPQPPAPEQPPEARPHPSGQVGLLPPAPPAAVAPVQPKPAEPRRAELKPAEPRRAEPRPAAPRPAASIRRPAQTPTPSAHVAQIVISSEAARYGDDPISSPIVLAGGQEKRLVLYTDLRGLAGRTVSHRWQHEGRTVAVIPFKVGGDRWRVHSNKRVSSGMKGEWQALVVDSDGTVLASRSFVVR